MDEGQDKALSCGSYNQHILVKWILIFFKLASVTEEGPCYQEEIEVFCGEEIILYV